MEMNFGNDKRKRFLLYTENQLVTKKFIFE